MFFLQENAVLRNYARKYLGLMGHKVFNLPQMALKGKEKANVVKYQQSAPWINCIQKSNEQLILQHLRMFEKKVFKKKNLLVYTTRMKFIIIMLSERSQTSKYTYHLVMYSSEEAKSIYGDKPHNIFFLWGVGIDWRGSLEN